MVNIGEFLYRVLETAPKFGLREEIEFVPMYLRLGKQHRKRKFSVLFIQVVKKSALHVQNLLFFYLLIGLVSFDVLVAVAVAVAAPAAVARSSLLPGFIDVCKRLGIRSRFG